MSFQDLGGEPRASTGAVDAGISSIASGVFQLNTAVAGFRRLVDAVGTAKDTPDHRQKLREARKRIGELVKETSGRLRELTDASHVPGRKAEELKLARDFQAVLADFQKAQKQAGEREEAYTPASPSRSTSLGSAEESSEDADQVWQQKRQQLISLDNEVSFNEAMIEEREQGIREIQYDIGEINDVFKDLVFLIDNQQPTIDDIGIHVEDASASATQTKALLYKASKSSRSRSSYCFWLLVVVVTVIIIVLLVIIIM